jgi:hypothetical protein
MRVISPLTWSVVVVLSAASAAGVATPVSRAATPVKPRSVRTAARQTGRRVVVSAPVRYIPFVSSLDSVIPKKGTRPSPPTTTVIELLIGTGTAGMGLALPAILAGVVVVALVTRLRR